MNETVSTLRSNSGTCWRQTWEGVNYETMWNPQAPWIHIGLPVESYCVKEEVSAFNLKNWRQLFLLCGILVSQILSSSPYWLSPSSVSTTVSRLEMLTRTRSHPCLPLSCNQITGQIGLSNIIGVGDEISSFDSWTTACCPQTGFFIAHNHTSGQSSYQKHWFTSICSWNFS